MAGATLYPTAIDDDTTFSDDKVSGNVIDPTEHDSMVLAIRALEAKVGVTGSAVTTSDDYKIVHGMNPNEFQLPNFQNFTLAANTDDLTVAATTSTLRLTATTSTRNLTGIAVAGGNRAGQILIVQNVGTSIAVVLKNDTTSTAANRFFSGADITLAAHQGAVIRYDATDSRWVVIATSVPGTGGGSVTLVNKGAWNSGTSYVVNDFVLSNNSSWLCIVNNSNSVPTTVNTNWQLLAAGGTNGLDGSAGAVGNTGAQGLQGLPGPSAEALSTVPVSGTTLTLDAGAASYYAVTLSANCTITLADTLGRQVSAITLRLKQGAGGSKLVTWANVSLWVTAGATAPTLATAAGAVNVITFDQVNGEWFGYVGGGSGTVTPPTIPTIDMEVFAAPAAIATTGGQTADYVFGGSYQVGNGKGGIVDVVTTRATTDPPVPTLTGAGAGTWTQVATTLNGTGATRRRLTRFACYDATSGAAAGLTVGIGGVSHTGCVIIGTRSVGIVTITTWKNLVLSNSAVNKFDDAGASGTVALTTLASPGSASNRGLACAFDNVASPGAGSGFTPEANWIVLQTTNMSNPGVTMVVMKNTTAFDTTPSGTWGAASNWAIVASELHQG